MLELTGIRIAGEIAANAPLAVRAAKRMLRHAATEPPGSSPLLNEHRKGVFGCVGCIDSPTTFPGCRARRKDVSTSNAAMPTWP